MSVEFPRLRVVIGVEKLILLEACLDIWTSD